MVACKEKWIDIFFKILEWSLLLGLCFTSFSFLKDVWDKYEAEDTNFKISREKPTKGPTIVLCLISSNKSFELDKDFTLFYVNYGSHFERDKKKLKKGDTIISSTGTTLVNYETIITPWDSCHKISVRNISDAPWSGIKINFNESVLDLPQLNIQIMDDENSYGIIYGRMTGKAITYPVEFGKALWVQLQPEKFKYLSKSQSPKSTCGQRSYYECIESELLEKIESNCSKKCYPMHTKIISISKCVDEKIRRCAGNVIIENVYNGAGLKSQCKKPCEILQYLEYWKFYMVNYSIPNNNPNDETNLWFWFWYQFEDVDEKGIIVNEEYLIYDTINMIGSLGGTLGLFIGFSFSNVLDVMIISIKRCFMTRGLIKRGAIGSVTPPILDVSYKKEGINENELANATSYSKSEDNFFSCPEF